MNSAVKQLPRSIAQAVGRWAALAGVLLALPALGQGSSVTQSGTITINDAAFELGQHLPRAASPYPGRVSLSNLLGNVQKVTVTLPNLTHGYAADLDVMLVRTNDGARIKLLSDVALNFPFNGVTLTIDDAAANSLPAAGAVASGSYKSTDFNGGDADVFPAPAPGGSFVSLGSLAGSHPNAGWELYIVDDKNQDAGSVGGWTLSVWTTPVFTEVPTSVTNKEDTQFTVTVKIDDSDTPADQLKLTASSSNQTIITNTAFNVSATGKTRTITFTPLPNANGEVTVTLKLEDSISKEASAITTTFRVVIEAVNDGPTIALNQNSVTSNAGVLTTNVLFARVADVDNNVDTLTLLVKSTSNSNLVTPNDVFFTRGTSGTNFFTIAPRAGATGTATIEIGVSDGAVTNVQPFNVTIVPTGKLIVGNPASITIADNTTASPYPSSVTVSNVFGTVGNVVVTLADLTHTRPEDLDVLLVGPSGTGVVLMGQAGGSNPLNRARISFASGGVALPDSGVISSGTVYDPEDFVPGPLPSPAPTGPYATSLAAFNGTNPNGTWSLYVVDRASGEAGILTGGFQLEFRLAPIANAFPATVTTDEDVKTTFSFSVADFDGAVTNVVAESTVPSFATFKATLTGTNVSIEVTPVANVFGTNDVRVVLWDDGNLRTTNTFSLRIRSVNDTPSIDPIAKQITYAGLPLENVKFTVRDVGNETAPAQLEVTARSNNTKLLPDSNIILGVDGADVTGATRTVSLYPVGPSPGTVTVTLTVRDTGNPVAESTTSFTFEVLVPASPLYANTSPIVIQDSGTSGGATNADVYPSQITISNLVGEIQQVKVTLLGLQHPLPEDIDILLVGPNNHKVKLMSDAGGNLPISNTQLLFTDDGAALPQFSRIVSGNYRPTDYDGGDPDSFPNVPGGGTTGTTLNS